MVSRSSRSAPMLSGCHGFSRLGCQISKYLQIWTACVLTLEGQRARVVNAEKANGTSEVVSGLGKD